jgi:hypothetical protein
MPSLLRDDCWLYETHESYSAKYANLVFALRLQRGKKQKGGVERYCSALPTALTPCFRINSKNALRAFPLARAASAMFPPLRLNASSR